MSFPSGRAARRAVTVALISLTAAACGGGADATVAATVPPGGSQPPAAGASSAPLASPSLGTTGHLGTALGLMDGNGNNLAVTLVKVFDPASVTADSKAAAAAANSRWFGVELSVVDLDAATAGQTLRVDGVGSDGSRLDPTATAYGIGPFAECTSSTGDPSMGQPSTWCGGFMVPVGVSVTKVGYTAAASSGQADQVTWTLP